jgi:hypothetical protein
MIAPGAVGWMVLAVAGLLWLTLVAVSSGQLVGPARLTRWILFCQRP